MSIKFGDKDYALVPDRLKKFRESNPRASIKSESIRHEDGSIEFVTVIVQDRADEYSAEADGHAVYSESELKKAKAFEKLETISVGRALAKLGYLNDGQIASTEELLEFNDYKQNKVDEAIDNIKALSDIEELKKYFLSLGTLGANELIFKAKEAKKKELIA